ncbi:MAG: DUF6285 domain-containing protein [Gammaproteobacteria bacterium]
MAHDNPDLTELILTVREFIQDITDELSGQSRYHALCAVFLLEVVERELAQWAPHETEDDLRLKALLGEDVPREQILPTLCTKIRNGAYKSEDNKLLEAMLQHVEAKIAVIKPKHFGLYKK